MIYTISMKFAKFIYLFAVLLGCSQATKRQSSAYVQTLTGIGDRIRITQDAASQILTPESSVFDAEDYHRKILQRAESLLNNRQTLTASTYNVSETCLNDTFTQVIALFQQQTWAISMLDAAGKLPSGILNGALQWYGDYDECVAVTAVVYPGPQNETKPEYPFSGRYCRVGIPLSNQSTPQAMFGMWPMGTFVLGLCIPNSCDEADLLEMLNSGLHLVPVAALPNITLAVCQREELEYDTRAIAVLTVIGVFIALLIVGTMYDVVFVQWLPHMYIQQEADLPDEVEKLNGEVVVDSDTYSEQTSNIRYRKRANENTPLITEGKEQTGNHQYLPRPGLVGQLLLSFSVYTNGAKILDTSQSSSSLRAIHGIRFLSMSWVILGHSLMWAAMSADNILPYITALIKRWTFQAIINATVSVDSFFTLSGLLVAYTVLKEMKAKGDVAKLNWGMFYFHRFWRLTPPYLFVLMVYVPLIQYWSNGPLWPQKGTEIDYCRTTWWTNLLYVNNFVYADKMCMGWSWYLANDMQFYVVSPLLLVPLYYSGLLGGIVCLVFLLAVFITSGVLSSVYNLPPSILGAGGPGAGIAGPDPQVMMDYQSVYYFKPYCRMGPYIVGTFTGYLLYKMDCKIKMSRVANLLGWAIAAVCCLSVLYGLYDPMNGHPLNDDASALYNAVHRSVWAVGLCWVIFACATGHGGFINTLLSWEALIPLSRLSYCAYLVHPVIMEVYQLNRRSPPHLDDLEVIYLFFAHLVASYAVAFVTSLAFEAPMMALEKVLFRREKKT